MNNRDHRKIAVIDGKVAFTGGFNIADEYFNITHPYGYWKDTGIKIKGQAVRSFARHNRVRIVFIETSDSLFLSKRERGFATKMDIEKEEAIFRIRLKF